jgi:hypothetical protein
VTKHYVRDTDVTLGLSGEQKLITTLLIQAAQDLHSRDQDIRHAALDFLHSRDLEFWTSLVGVDRVAWQEHAFAALRRRAGT